jgi:hypothetical protein
MKTKKQLQRQPKDLNLDTTFLSYTSTDSLQNVVKSLKGIIDDKFEDTSSRVKAIEVFLAYALGKPKDKDSEIKDSVIRIEHNVISLEDAKQLTKTNDRNKLKD